MLIRVENLGNKKSQSSVDNQYSVNTSQYVPIEAFKELNEGCAEEKTIRKVMNMIYTYIYIKMSLTLGKSHIHWEESAIYSKSNQLLVFLLFLL